MMRTKARNDMTKQFLSLEDAVLIAQREFDIDPEIARIEFEQKCYITDNQYTIGHYDGLADAIEAITERTKETGGEIMAPSTYKYNVYLYDDESPRFEDVPLKTFRNIEYSQMVDIAESATQFMDMLVVVEKALMTTEVEDHGGNEEE